MSIQQPPQIDGVISLTDTEKADIQAKLQAIKQLFIASDDSPVCDTFYLTSIYNKQYLNPINGDTCEFVLKN